MELHWLGVTTLANCAEVGGREKSQLLFGFRDQSLVCKRVSQQCSAKEGQPEGLSIKFQIWGFMLLVVGLRGFFNFVFPCLVWQGEARDSFLFPVVDSMQIFGDTKARLKTT